MGRGTALLGIRQEVSEEEWPFPAGDRFRVGWEQFTGWFSCLTNVISCLFWLDWRQVELSVCSWGWELVCSHIPGGWLVLAREQGRGQSLWSLWPLSACPACLAGLGEAQGPALGTASGLGCLSSTSQTAPGYSLGVLACSHLENAITWWRRAWRLLLLLQGGVWAAFPSLLHLCFLFLCGFLPGSCCVLWSVLSHPELVAHPQRDG